MDNIKELLKLAADSMKDRSLNKLLSNDTEYQKRYKKRLKAYKKYEKLDLTEEQRNVIENYLAKKAEAEYDYNTNVYMSGLLDAYEILKLFNLTKE